MLNLIVRLGNMKVQMEINYKSLEWDEAIEMAYQRAREEGDVDLDCDEELIFTWAEEYYNDIMKMKG